MNGNKKWAVVGGGMLGMMIAYRLSQKNFDVTLFEAENTLGGLTSPWKLNDITWDKFYHVISTSDSHLLSFLEELNLQKEISWKETKTGFITNGKLYSMSNVLEFLKFPPLNFLNKIRLALTIFLASRIKNWKKLEQIPAEQWLRKWSGEETFKKIWLPLLKSKLGESYRETSAAFIWATIQRMYKARNSNYKKEMFGYVKGGYSKILNRFNDQLKNKAIKIKTGFAAKKVELQNNNKIKIKFSSDIPESNREENLFDAAVLTIPSQVAAAIATCLSDEEKRKLNGVKYLGVICASILLKKSLSEFYITNITDEKYPFTGIIEMTALVDKKFFDGNSLIYLPKYLSSDDPMFSLADEVIKNIFLESLKRVYPQLSSNEILCFKIARAKYVFSLSTLNYSERLPSIKTSIPNLYIVNSAHIVNGTLNVNETLQLAERTFEYLI